MLNFSTDEQRPEYVVQCTIIIIIAIGILIL